MKKSKLQHLDIVVTRDGTLHYYLEDSQKLVGKEGFLFLAEYDENLVQRIPPLVEDFDIVEVHRMEEPALDHLNIRYVLDVCATTLIWKKN